MHWEEVPETRDKCNFLQKAERGEIDCRTPVELFDLGITGVNCSVNGCCLGLVGRCGIVMFCPILLRTLCGEALS